MNKRNYNEELKELIAFLKNKPCTLLLPLGVVALGICYTSLWINLQVREQTLLGNIQSKESYVLELERYGKGRGNFAEYKAKSEAEIKVLEKRLENSRTPVEQLRFLQNSARECTLALTTLRQERNVLDKTAKSNVEGFKVVLTGDYFNLLRWLKLVEEKSQGHFYHFNLQGNEKTGLIALDAFIIF